MSIAETAQAAALHGAEQALLATVDFRSLFAEAMRFDHAYHSGLIAAATVFQTKHAGDDIAKQFDEVFVARSLDHVRDTMILEAQFLQLAGAVAK